MTDPVESLARKVVNDPFFLAPILEAYAAEAEDPDAELTLALGCQPRELTLLRLCRPPRSEPQQFRADIAEMADRFGLDPERLTRVVRRGEVLLKMRSSTSSSGLMAARDVEPDDGENS